MQITNIFVNYFYLKFKHSETKVSTSQNVSTSRNAQGVLEIIFTPSLIVSEVSRQNLVNCRFGGVLCETVHPESNVRFFCSCFLFGVALLFFVKTYLRVTKSVFEIIFAPSLRSLIVSQQGLVN